MWWFVGFVVYAVIVVFFLAIFRAAGKYDEDMNDPSKWPVLLFAVFILSACSHTPPSADTAPDIAQDAINNALHTSHNMEQHYIETHYGCDNPPPKLATGEAVIYYTRDKNGKCVFVLGKEN